MELKKISFIAMLITLTFISLIGTYFMNSQTSELDFGVIASMVVGILFVVIVKNKKRKHD
ncbi:MAG: hypothetical protein WCF60_00390 [Anaerobacillus sp.]